MIPADIYLAMIVKLAGAGCGAALALVYMPPRTWEGFWRRLMAAMVFGFAFAPYIRDVAGFGPTWEGSLGSATLAAFVSWSAMTAIIKAIRVWDWRAFKDRIFGQTPRS